MSKGENIVKWIKGQRISWLGHLERMEEDGMPKKFFIPELEGTRRKERPRKRWKEEVERDLQVLGVRNCATQSHNFPHPRLIACCSAPNSRPPATKALHTICGNNTSTVSSSWWWAYKCPKHVEQIISAIKPSVASVWFSYLRLYNDARTNIHKIITV